MTPPREPFVPGFGDANADFHVVGDHPGVHGGLDEAVPFAGNDWSTAFFDALARGGLLEGDDGDEPAGEPVAVDGTFLSYLHMCLPDGEPTADDYADMDRFFDAELRAIAAHVLLPVGSRATRRVLEAYTARAPDAGVDMERLHGREIRGSGWLVVPVRDPSEWGPDDADRLVDALRELQRTDFQREADLGRFLPGDDPYLVR